MSKELEIDGVRFESSASIAQRFNYTQDYVGKLARDGKVIATKVGRFWFVDVSSFEKFIEISEVEKLQRSETLRGERRKERSTIQEELVDFAPKIFSSQEKKKPVVTDHYIVLAQAVAVVFCGVFVGVLGWTAQGLQFAQLQQGGSNVVGQMQEVFAFSGNVAFGNTGQRNISQSADAIEAVSKQQVFTELPILGYEQKVVTEEVPAKEPGYPFSDEVEVVREEDGVQIVRPLFDEATDEVEYRVSVEAINPSTK